MSPRLVDTHAHLDEFDRAGHVADALARARAAGVGGVLAVGGSPEANERAVRLAAAYGPAVAAAVGLDRHRAGCGDDPAAVRALLARPGVVAVGETGLDYHHEPGTRAAQIALFAAMLDLAREYGRPVVVHTREADGDTREMLAEHARRWRGEPGRIGVVHCFTGGADFARELVAMGFHLGIAGIVTFRNAGALREVAAAVPAERLLLETDAPYLSPAPLRGRRNEPAHLPHTAAAVAALRGCAPGELARITAANAARLFGWPAWAGGAGGTGGESGT